MVDLVILRYGSRDTIAWLLRNEKLKAGTYSVLFDGQNQTNGVYVYILKFNNNVIEKNMLLMKNQAELVSSNPLVKTDKDGNFKLPFNILAIGLSFIKTGEESPEPISKMIISDNLSLFMVKEGYQNYLEEMKVDTNLTITKTFKLKK